MLDQLLSLLQNGVLPLLLALWVATPPSTPLTITMLLTALVIMILYHATAPTIRVSPPPSSVIHPLDAFLANIRDRRASLRLQHEARMEAYAERYRILEAEYRAQCQDWKKVAARKQWQMD
ncbi:hypothetical protein MMC20_003888 [Loxospora ochrophaea]|nr:hypothetical protein [Loxospora ochrophaea]